MPTQHPDMTQDTHRRSVHELRVALSSLEQLAPDADALRNGVVRPRPRSLPRRRAAAATVACALVCAAAVAGLVGRGPTPPLQPTSHPSLRQAMLTAFDSAAGMVLESRQTFRSRGVISGRAVSWSGPTLPRAGQTARYRTVSMTPGGHPVSELAELYTAATPNLHRLADRVVGPAGVVRRLTDVDYSSRTWMSQTTHQPEILSLADNPTLLRAEIAQGWWGKPKPVRVDGRPAIELTWNQTPAPTSWPVGQAQLHGVLHRTLWVDSHTYLPIRQRIQLAGGSGGALLYAVTASYQLLPPTAENLAKLRPLIPPEFHQN
jgi:hypothetical protein